MKTARPASKGKVVFVIILTLALAALPAVAFAEITEQTVNMTKYITAGAAMIVSAIAAAFAQAKIGTAAAGTIAEKPEAATMLIVLQALPEIIVLLGFVTALIISG